MSDSIADNDWLQFDSFLQLRLYYLILSATLVDYVIKLEDLLSTDKKVERKSRLVGTENWSSEILTSFLTILIIR